MNFNLISTNVWELGIWLLAGVLISLAIFVFAAIKLRTRYNHAIDLRFAHKAVIETIDSKLNDTDNIEMSHQESVALTEERNKESKLHDKAVSEEENATGLFIIGFGIMIAIVIIAACSNLLYVYNATTYANVSTVQKAINSTYNVEISRYETEQLMASDKDGGLPFTDAVLNESSKKWQTVESYGTTEILQDDGVIVEAQLIRVKKDFKLVYAGDSKTVETLVEIPKR